MVSRHLFSSCDFSSRWRRGGRVGWEREDSSMLGVGGLGGDGLIEVMLLGGMRRDFGRESG
jgi:hypothetical protein